MSLRKRIEREARKISKTFDVAGRVDTMAKQECFITLKDHKEDYRTNSKYRLLKPTKSQPGKISKQLLQKSNKTLRSKLNLNQLQNSSEVIDWFKHIQQKSSHTFTVFDIQEFYLSITEKLLKDALAFVQRHVEIKQNELHLIFHTLYYFIALLLHCIITLLQRYTVDKKRRKRRILCYIGEQ